MYLGLMMESPTLHFLITGLGGVGTEQAFKQLSLSLFYCHSI